MASADDDSDMLLSAGGETGTELSAVCGDWGIDVLAACGETEIGVSAACAKRGTEFLVA